MSSGIITNIVEVDPAIAPTLFPGSVQIDTLPEIPGIGWRKNGDAFERPASLPPQAAPHFGPKK